MIKPTIIASLLLFLPNLSKGGINYSHSGYANATTVNRLSDGSIIKMPYRVLSYEPVLSSNNFNIVANTALEFRLKDISQIMDSDLRVDLRELYIEWMTPLGDFSLGKQIITWGSASENNPTDNISPYNYYYLFSMGKERKEGIFSLNSTFYYQNLKLNAIFIPEHNPNTLPLNDPEFSLSIPIVPTDEQIMELDNPYEYGISINIPFSSMDVTTSYFSGYDRIVSFFGANVWTDYTGNPQSIIAIDTVLSFRKTDIYGLGLSYYTGDITIRGDIGYFITSSDINRSDSALYRYYAPDTLINHCEDKNNSIENDPFSSGTLFPDCKSFPTFNNTELINNNAEYYQYILEIEYSPGNDYNFISQYTKHKLEKIGLADSIRTSDTTVVFDPLIYFIPGMGSPNIFISSNAISISARKSFPDWGLELSYTSMFDLDKKGALHGAGLEYEIFKNTNLLIEVTKIFNNDEIQMNPFTAMKDFSRILFEIRYFY
ncbi:uncharacterized protein METZ01_LOCUS133811 [marine metagenome]|uniref:Uncharacterized protein n=1 Tax=marine metagenome TaxID=408172 RepID=A0A381YWU3_9ZZZZ